MKLINKLLFVVLAIVIGAGGAASYVVFNYYKSVSLSELNTNLNQSSLIYDSEGVLLDEVHGEEHRKIVPLKDIDTDIINAVIAIEDSNFRKHKGVSIRGVGRAAVKNIRTRSKSEGASTITMQLTKNLIGSVQERTWENKIREVFLALKLERNLTKNEILTLYLNTIYWGNNTYGIETATETYFGKSAKEVTVAEASLLAAMIQNPSRYNIYQNNRDSAYKSLKNRQLSVLNNMSYDYSQCKLDGTQNQRSNYKTCLEEWTIARYNEPLLFSGKTSWQASSNGYITDLAIQEAIDTIDGIDSVEDIEVGGYKIYSTINKKHQDLALKVVNGYKVKGQQIALGAVNPKTNLVSVSVGGYNYIESPLNRTTKNAGLRGRQPGSSQKTYVYYKGFEQGWDPSDIINDRSTYPQGWGQKDYVIRGASDEDDTLLNHLKWSRNGAAVNLGRKVRISNVINLMQDLGITTKLDNVISFPLGSNDVVLLEHVNAYAAFANNGRQTTYSSLLKVEDNNGNVILDNSNRTQYKKLTSTGVDKINSVLRETAAGGTATAANTIANVKAKTGTTDNNADVWCMAYNDKISAGVWRGYDDYNKKLWGAYGGTYACPVMGNFLRAMDNNNYLD